RDASSIASSWSWKICFESYSRRPISVDLPSSPEPVVASRTSSMSWRFATVVTIRSWFAGGGGRGPSEVPLPLAVLHGSFADPVVGAAGSAFGDTSRGHFLDDLLDRLRLRFEGGGAGHVSDRAEPYVCFEDGLTVHQLQIRALGHEHAVPLEHPPAVTEVDGRKFDALLEDVLVDVHLRPVRDREHPHVLAAPMPGVVQTPQLGPLVLRIPLAELVAEAEDPLLGPGLLLVPAGTSEHRVELVLVDGIDERLGLEAVA